MATITRPTRSGSVKEFLLTHDELTQFDHISASLSIQPAMFQTAYLSANSPQRAEMAKEIGEKLSEIKNILCGCSSGATTAAVNEIDDKCFPFCTDPDTGGCIPCGGGGSGGN